MCVLRWPLPLRSCCVAVIDLAARLPVCSGSQLGLELSSPSLLTPTAIGKSAHLNPSALLISVDSRLRCNQTDSKFSRAHSNQ